MRALLFALVAVAACAPAPVPTVPLFDGLGSHHHPITVRNEEAQAYFDQGLRLSYGFNHAEAIRSFEQAARLDETCAMCWWGVAFAAGPNINALMDSAGGVVAWDAIGKAQALAENASESDQAYIQALAQRYGPDPTAARAPLDSAYAAAMASVAERFPDDDDAQVLHADAIMNRSPWDYWNVDRSPKPGTPELLAALERVVARSPEHAGACHLYIHAVEKVDAQRAVPCAERLPALMPSAGHIVHMPAHIFIRVGRYVDAIEHNHAATHADERYIHAEKPQGIYPLAYYPHNYDFLAFAAAMAGHRAEALEAARSGAAAVDTAMSSVPALGGLQNYLVLPQRLMVRFGLWDEILAEPVRGAGQPFVAGYLHYARGMALLRTGQADAAKAELDQLKASLENPDLESVYVWWNPGRPILSLGALALEAELLHADGKHDAAVSLLEQAVAIEDGLIYDEPPPWSTPSRHVLGRMHLEKGHFAAAEAVFRADLAQHPENGWGLFGLARALEAQGKTDEAAAVMARFDQAWSSADFEPAPGSV